jgi:hypothetical protein
MKQLSNNQTPIWFKIYLNIKLLFKKPFIVDKINLLITIFTILVNAAIWLFLYFNLRLDPFNIVLHYRVYEGAIVINTPENAFVLAEIGLLIFLTNLILAIFIFRKARILCHLSLINSFLCQIMLLISSITVVLANK